MYSVHTFRSLRIDPKVLYQKSSTGDVGDRGFLRFGIVLEVVHVEHASRVSEVIYWRRWGWGFLRFGIVLEVVHVEHASRSRNFEWLIVRP